MTILIVDDHADIRKLLKQILSVGQSEVPEFIECEYGNEAIRLYKTHKPDVVLMDVELRSVNGLEATKEILVHDKNANIIIITSYNSPSVRRRAEQSAVKAFLSKDDLSKVYKYVYEPNNVLSEMDSLSSTKKTFGAPSDSLLTKLNIRTKNVR